MVNRQWSMVRGQGSVASNQGYYSPTSHSPFPDAINRASPHYPIPLSTSNFYV
ncbi:hypothetical protein H6G89_27360 [Oscillatoria sp. FACHB-1407]|uniref:hypothetical protein n=1 Tax=Oscillatoria sp. FACHB-1407 TaxID=2692847 RepID=UPI001688DDBB|nr:hypothetical protein [Oscillatoria sp. FACHB-1407]MBD2464727.1 hypothetical protein [Oscillatoria sp. FACHB-1407]